MEKTTVNALKTLDNRYILEVHTKSNKVITCKIRFISTTSFNDGTNDDEIAGILGYRFPDESENDIYQNGLELERSIPFKQIKDIYVKL